MKTFLRDFEWMIEHTAVPVYDSTEGGALKKGAEIKSLKDSLSTHADLVRRLQLDFNDVVSGRLQKYFQSFTSNPYEETMVEEFIMPFTSYLLQVSESSTPADKKEDLESSHKYLETIIQCPIHKGVNQALFVDSHADERVLSWAEAQGLCIYTPKDLVESLHLCKELELAKLYCCDGFIDPDILLLTDIEVIDIKVSTEPKPYERCLWVPTYQVLLLPEVEEYWRQCLPGDVKLTAIDCDFLEQGQLYGMH